MNSEWRFLLVSEWLILPGSNRAKHSKQEIAELIGVDPSTISRELRRGRYIHTKTTLEEEDRYCPEKAHEKYRSHLKKKGREKKILEDPELANFIENKIVEDRFSPYATLVYIEKNNLEFKTNICLSTLYNYIRKNVFEKIELADLPYRRSKGKKKKRVQKRACQGTSIEKRREEINERSEIGHWEMDTVKGTQRDSQKTLLVLTERKTRIEIIELLNRNTAHEVRRAIDRIERSIGEKKFRDIFKTITVDNGPEFSDVTGMERSRRNKRNRTKIYYCHPYSSYERGSNENANRLIRRHLPKGISFDECTRSRRLKIRSRGYPLP